MRNPFDDGLSLALNPKTGVLILLTDVKSDRIAADSRFSSSEDHRFTRTHF
ncbi:MAG TPA: hypothetical protein PLR25_05900 [Planctomycetaceae bacterium]|nr:hypothetical protein [Planctomycetaceae bacterium]